MVTNEQLLSAIEDLGRRLRQVEDLVGVSEGYSTGGYYGDGYYGVGPEFSVYQELVELKEYVVTNLPPAIPGEGPYRISFTLKDSSKVVIPEAIIKAYYSGQETVIRQTTSDANGSFILYFTTDNEIDLKIESDNHNGKWMRGLVPQLA